jgi:hypothetical protein
LIELNLDDELKKKAYAGLDELRMVFKTKRPPM